MKLEVKRPAHTSFISDVHKSYRVEKPSRRMRPPFNVTACRLDTIAKGRKQTRLKALSHGAIFLATCNAILLLRDAN